MDQSGFNHRPAQLGELADYQEGAVVSRTLIKSAHGSVTVFAFDEGQELSEHRVPFDALVFILDGTAEIRVSGVAHEVSAGEAIRMPAGEPHAVRAVQRFKMLLSMVKA
jgi:quercetin dioxygenase-like cupin family protein